MFNWFQSYCECAHRLVVAFIRYKNIFFNRESNEKLEEESKYLKKKNASLKSKLNELQRVELAFKSQARELENARKELEECQK